ncbi:MAG: acyltransferase domain-containing protein [Planctomycetota bacterium]
MELDLVLRELGLEEGWDAIAPGWEESLASLPKDGLFFLEGPFLREACAYLGLPEGVAEQTLRAAACVRRSRALEALLRHASRRHFQDDPGIRAWPMPRAALGEDAGLFPFLALLSKYPVMRSVHEAHRVPTEVVEETLSDFPFYFERYLKDHGVYGLNLYDAAGWLRYHVQGTIYQIGRLQYLERRLPPGRIVFRHEKTRRVAALAQGELTFRADGQRQGASGIVDEAGAWTSKLSLSDTEACGHPVDPATGAALREAVVLKRAAWREALRPGDPGLDIHIPARGAFDVEACADSTERAAAFFAGHFPETPPAKAFFCTSWLLDAQLEEYLVPDSNLVRFLREFYLYPVAQDPWGIFRFVFELEIPYGWKGPVDLSKLEARTALQRAVLDHVRSGRLWRQTGGFRLVDDLPWGSAPYRRRARPWEA